LSLQLSISVYIAAARRPPEDAFRCFMGSEIEVLVVGNCYLRKEAQNPALKLDYKNAFELD
jgi:carbamoyltransferase